MAKKPAIVTTSGEEIRKEIPKVKAVKPFGSKILVEILTAKDTMNTSLHLSDSTESGDAPQAYILELGPQVDTECGLSVGDRVYWEGKGLAIKDPRATDRQRALLEVHNVKAIIVEE